MHGFAVKAHLNIEDDVLFNAAMKTVTNPALICMTHRPTPYRIACACQRMQGLGQQLWIKAPLPLPETVRGLTADSIGEESKGDRI